MFKHPMRAHMRTRTRERLIQLCQRAPVAVLTGRPIKDARLFLEDVPVRIVVGNHGAEWSRGSNSKHLLSQRLRSAVLAWAETQTSVVVEDKNGFGMSIHWRDATAAQVRAIAAFVRSLKGVRIVPGHCLFNVLPKRAPHKGKAIVPLRKALGRDKVVFVGDDVTDEFVFAQRRTWLCGIRVGQQRSSAADWYIPRQLDMDALLLAFLRGVPISRASAKAGDHHG